MVIKLKWDKIFDIHKYFKAKEKKWINPTFSNYIAISSGEDINRIQLYFWFATLFMSLVDFF